MGADAVSHRDARVTRARDVLAFVVQRRRTIGAIFIGYSLLAAMQFGLGAWTPEFFIRTYGWDRSTIGYAYGLTYVFAGTLGVPLIEAGCAAWLECRLIREPHTEDAYDTCFGEVVAAAADSRVFANGRWRFDESNRALQTIHHLGGGSFVVPGGVVNAKPLARSP